MTAVSLAVALLSPPGLDPDVLPMVAVLPVPVAMLFWLWLLASIVILIYRQVQRSSKKREAADQSTSGEVAPPTRSASFDASILATPAVPPPTAESAQPSRPAYFDAPPAPSQGKPTAPSVPTSGRAGFFASDSADSGHGMSGTPRSTVADALSGIVMPCGLTPVVDATVAVPNPFRVAFLTTEADGPTVGAAVGDELERLGFALTTSAATELLARKPGTELRVILYPMPSTARQGLDPLFPAAPSGSTGIEFAT